MFLESVQVSCDRSRGKEGGSLLVLFSITRGEVGVTTNDHLISSNARGEGGQVVFIEHNINHWISNIQGDQR